jgi:hypothetical protein
MIMELLLQMSSSVMQTLLSSEFLKSNKIHRSVQKSLVGDTQTDTHTHTGW